MYTSFTILASNILYIFEFDFKLTLTPFCILILFIKTNIINLIQIMYINFRVDVILCFTFHNLCLVLLQDDIINCMLNYRIFILLYDKFLLSCRLVPVVLSKPFQNTYNQSIPSPYIHLMNVQGHGQDKLAWIYPLDAIHTFFYA